MNENKTNSEIMTDGESATGCNMAFPQWYQHTLLSFGIAPKALHAGEPGLRIPWEALEAPVAPSRASKVQKTDNKRSLSAQQKGLQSLEFILQKEVCTFLTKS